MSAMPRKAQRPALAACLLVALLSFCAKTAHCWCVYNNSPKAISVISFPMSAGQNFMAVIWPNTKQCCGWDRAGCTLISSYRTGFGEASPKTDRCGTTQVAVFKKEIDTKAILAKQYFVAVASSLNDACSAIPAYSFLDLVVGMTATTVQTILSQFVTSSNIPDVGYGLGKPDFMVRIYNGGVIVMQENFMDFKPDGTFNAVVNVPGGYPLSCWENCLGVNVNGDATSGQPLSICPNNQYYRGAMCSAYSWSAWSSCRDPNGYYCGAQGSQTRTSIYTVGCVAGWTFAQTQDCALPSCTIPSGPCTDLNADGITYTGVWGNDNTVFGNVWGCKWTGSCPSGGSWSNSRRKCLCLPYYPYWNGATCTAAPVLCTGLNNQNVPYNGQMCENSWREVGCCWPPPNQPGCPTGGDWSIRDRKCNCMLKTPNWNPATSSCVA